MHHATRRWQLFGVIVPIIVRAVLAVVHATWPGWFAATGGAVTIVITYVVLGLVGRMLLRPWVAPLLVPLVYQVTYWTVLPLACPACHGFTYDLGWFGAILLRGIGSLPVVLGAAVGVLLARRALRRGSAPPASRPHVE